MKTKILGIGSAAFLALAGCEGMTPEGQALTGAALGAGAGYLTAEAFDANDNWQILATLAGAGVGSMVARNQQTGDCAYARGDGTYVVRPCPR